MKMIYGLAAVGGGELRVLGMDAQAASGARSRRGIGVVPQETNLDGDLTVRENLILQAQLLRDRPRRAARRARTSCWSSRCSRDRADERIQALSGGMKRRLLIARALVNDPELIVLDEPTTGLDPQARLAVWRALERLRRQGVTLLLTTHYMEEAARLCDRLLIMDDGRIVTEGEPGGAGPRARRRARCSSSSWARAAMPRRWSESLDGRVDGHELPDGALTLFADDAEELLRSLDHERFPTDSAWSAGRRSRTSSCG